MHTPKRLYLSHFGVLIRLFFLTWSSSVRVVQGFNLCTRISLYLSLYHQLAGDMLRGKVLRFIWFQLIVVVIDTSLHVRIPNSDLRTPVASRLCSLFRALYVLVFQQRHSFLRRQDVLRAHAVPIFIHLHFFRQGAEFVVLELVWLFLDGWVLRYRRNRLRRRRLVARSDAAVHRRRQVGVDPPVVRNPRRTWTQWTQARVLVRKPPGVGWVSLAISC